MKKIKNILIHVALSLCFFSLAGMVIGQQKGVECGLQGMYNILKATRDPNFECRYNIKVKAKYLNWTNSPGNNLPHGIYINVTGGSIGGIGPLVSTPNQWLFSPLVQQVPSTISSNLHDIFWIRQVNCGGLNNIDPATRINAIPDGETLVIPVDIIPDPGSPDIKFHLAYILGKAWPYCKPIPLSDPVDCGACTTPLIIPPCPTIASDLDCEYYYTFPHDTCNYQIICNEGDSWPPNFIPFDCILCLPQNKDAILTLSPVPTPSPWTTITWYKCTTCPLPCTTVTYNDLTSTGSPWTQLFPEQIYSGGQQPFYATGQMTETTCYAAVIKTGCDICITDPITLWVCNPLPGINISANPALTVINNELHACEQWSGTLSIPYSGITCETHVTWERGDYQQNQWIFSPIQSLNYYPPNSNPAPNPFEVSVTNLVCNISPTDCDSLYRFRVVLEDICDNSTESIIEIHIDKRTEDCSYTFTAVPPVPPTNWIGNVPGTTILNPIFCESGATVLEFTSECLKIKQWEFTELSDPCGSATWSTWHVLSEAGTSPIYWTNVRHNTRRYRVWIYNGSCNLNNPLYSSELEVTIIPEQTLTLTSDHYYICPGCPLPTLTATISCSAQYPVTSYQWELNGTIVATTTGNTFQVNVPGAWTVTAIGGICGPVQSNRVIICGPPTLSVEGPWCCIPPVMFTGGPWCFCDGETIPLHAVVSGCNVQNITYEWKDSNGQVISTNASVNITSPGTYTVTAICDNCCVITATATTYLCPSTSP